MRPYFKNTAARSPKREMSAVSLTSWVGRARLNLLQKNRTSQATDRNLCSKIIGEKAHFVCFSTGSKFYILLFSPFIFFPITFFFYSFYLLLYIRRRKAVKINDKKYLIQEKTFGFPSALAIIIFRNDVQYFHIWIHPFM